MEQRDFIFYLHSYEENSSYSRNLVGFSFAMSLLPLGPLQARKRSMCSVPSSAWGECWHIGAPNGLQGPAPGTPPAEALGHRLLKPQRPLSCTSFAHGCFPSLMPPVPGSANFLESLSMFSLILIPLHTASVGHIVLPPRPSPEIWGEGPMTLYSFCILQACKTSLWMTQRPPGASSSSCQDPLVHSPTRPLRPG